jgi:hypothetical protein
MIIIFVGKAENAARCRKLFRQVDLLASHLAAAQAK